MKKGFRLTAATLVLMLVLSVPSYGWSDTGHMAVAFVAYQNLTPQARARVDALVSLNPKINLWRAALPAGTNAATRRLMLFMIAATWADQIKGDGEHQSDGPSGGNLPPTDGTAARNTGYSDMAMHKYWHYIDVPFSLDGTPLHNSPVPNALTQIAAFRSVLASTSPDSLKSYDLVWLLHVVGDVHQPLHCTARFTRVHPNGDDGGNGVTILNGPNSQRLHSFWDGLLGTTRWTDPQAAITVGRSLAPANAALANNLNAGTWISEGFADARSKVYKDPPIGPGSGPFTITSTYHNAARTLAKQRVALAGARLAKILNRELR